MATSATNSLLALLIVIQSLPAPLSESELETLTKLGQKLKMQPEKWDNAIAKHLKSFLDANSTFDELYQKTLTLLDEQDIPAELMEMDVAEASPHQAEERGYKPGKATPSLDNRIINDLVVPILISDSPTTTAQQSNLLKRLQNFIQQLGK